MKIWTQAFILLTTGSLNTTGINHGCLGRAEATLMELTMEAETVDVWIQCLANNLTKVIINLFQRGIVDSVAKQLSEKLLLRSGTW